MKGSFSTNSFVGGIVIGVLFAGAWFFSGALTVTPVISSSPLNIGTATSTPKSGSVSVSNQAPGNVVIVESVTVPPPGVWVAVREVSGGDLRNVLGAVRVNGPRRNISVPLLRATESGRSYVVQLYRDDGNGVFDVAVNSVYVDFDTGARVVAYFTTTN